ncbi:MAG: guaA 2 [Gammaproteobacteria bacterium]|nr:guaA 2 [Gammaproteobacteria bacterium]
MRFHALIHAAFEKLGIIEAWIHNKQHQLTCSHTYAGDKLPANGEFDFLIVMGGPQSPRDAEKLPYLKAEIALIAKTIAQQKPVLGFCLGAQLIAESLGAKTERSPEKEIGIFPIELTEAGRQDPIFKDFPVKFNGLHWHYDMPSIPPKAVLLAKSGGCPHQAFRYGNKVYGLQFHLEPKLSDIQEMIKNCADDLAPSKFTQTEAELLQQDYSVIHNYMELILDKLMEGV